LWGIFGPPQPLPQHLDGQPVSIGRGRCHVSVGFPERDHLPLADLLQAGHAEMRLHPVDQDDQAVDLLAPVGFSAMGDIDMRPAPTWSAKVGIAHLAPIVPQFQGNLIPRRVIELFRRIQ
jgi:hypothetical protein